MILHRKSISNSTTSFRCFFILIVVLILFTRPILTIASTFTISDFSVTNDGINDSGLQYSTTLGLAINRYVGVKIFGDSLQSSVPPTIYSDVISSSIDTFTYFYILDQTIDGIYKRDVRIKDGFLPVLLPPVKVNTVNVAMDSYLHSDKGQSGFLVSVVKNGSGQRRILQVSTGTSIFDVDSATTTGWLFSSQCHMEEDTFLVVYSVAMASIRLKKIYAKGTDIRIINSATVSADTANGIKLMNCSVASDKNGKILVTWTRGSPFGVKYLSYQFFDRNFVAGTISATNQQVGDNSFYYYDDIPITALDTNRFAMIHWDNAGVILNKTDIQNGTATSTTSRILNRPGLRHATIASNSKYCIVACIGDADGNGFAGIEGLRYVNNNGTLLSAEPYSFSRDVNVNPINNYSTALNCALDSSGDFALTWRYQNRIQGSIFANRGIRNFSGFWTSPVESLAITPGDSIRFYNSIQSVSSLTSWTLADSIRFGSTTQACQSAPWITLADDQALRSNATTNRYFQYRIAITRKIGADSLTTPGISLVSLPWNAQPVIVGIDSIKIGSGSYIDFGVNRTVSVFTRHDSLRLQVSIRDSDPTDTIYMRGSWPADTSTIRLIGSSPFNTTLFFNPTIVDTSVQCTIFVWDAHGWQATTSAFSYTSRNALPVLTATAAFTNANNIRVNRTILVHDTILIQETDSLEITFSITDTNDQERVYGSLFSENQGVVTKLDSIFENEQSTFIIRGDTTPPSYPIVLKIAVNDQDTMFTHDILFAINHFPVIESLFVNKENVNRFDTVGVAIGGLTQLEIVAHDTDCAIGDTLTYYFTTFTSHDSVVSNAQRMVYKWRPARSDSFMNVTVSDKNKKSDSAKFFIKYPWFEIDSNVNRAYSLALDTLANGISLIVGNPTGDTVTLPITNSGNDTLTISSIGCSNFAKQWLKIGVPYDTGIYVVDFKNSVFSEPIKIGGNETTFLSFNFSTNTLTGDSIVTDTVFLITNDSSHVRILIPVYLEYNDLPKIVSINPDFIPDIPWRLSKKNVGQYTFPPHASISISFSEPIDTSSLYSGLSVYSLIDSASTGSATNINMMYKWSQNYTKVLCTPAYLSQSPVFQVVPSKGLFIPTDIIAVNLNSLIVDRATTPSGPNRLDVNIDNNRDYSTSDTTIRMNVDSIGFSILTITPVMFDTQINEKPEIKLTFSSPVYASSVDMSRSGNRTLIVRSAYNSGQQLDFDSISIDGSNVTFRIARKLFYCDSLWCWYNSSTIKNQMGFPSDNDNDGISITMFDTTNMSDDIYWSYRVKNIHIVSLSPDENSTVKEVSPSISITFSDTVDESIFDTSTVSTNRSLQIWSSYSSKRSSYRKISVLNDKKTVLFQPERKFFSKDSIFCSFFGFNKNYRYTRQLNIPDDTINNFNSYSWSFYTGNTGFYTYPNPYKPGIDPRHCSENGPCGIWFKNLHILKQGNFDVVVKVYSMNTHQIYNTRNAGLNIHFENNSTEFQPQWLWDTRNQQGELIASGLYFYSITDLDDHILTKGKIMIVR